MSFAIGFYAGVACATWFFIYGINPRSSLLGAFQQAFIWPVTFAIAAMMVLKK